MCLSSSTRIAILLFALSLIRGSIYSAIVPPWQAPDEPQHFEYAKLLYDERRLVAWDDISPSLREEITGSMRKHEFWKFAPVTRKPEQGQDLSKQLGLFWEGTSGQFHQPPGYYILGALALGSVSQSYVTVQLYVIRLVSTFMGAASILLAYLSMRILFPEDRFMQLGVPSFILFLPMHTHITSSVNNDNLAELIGSLTIYLVTLSWAKGLTSIRLAMLILSIIFGFLAKRTFFFAVPLVLLAVPLSVVLQPKRLSLLQKVGIVIGAIATLPTAIFLWWKGLLMHWFDMIYFHLIGTARFDSHGMLEVLVQRYPRYFQSLFEGFWGRFGWWSVPLNTVSYSMISVVCILAVLGTFLFAGKALRNKVTLPSWQRVTLVLYLLSAVTVVLLTMSWFSLVNLSDIPAYRGGSPQGRLLFPAIIPLATLFTLGIREVVPSRYRSQGLLVYIIGLSAFDLLTVSGDIIPFYY